ncbi:MAG: hypothetical protein NW220_22225 [Leptolyngbyaceae cyanobacterium bins.349]|nr:hypothetical protein [Leptolyngbyaceae cyanobacterium bins.349]
MVSASNFSQIELILISSMSNRKIIAELTDQQEALIPEYREKWRSIENQVESINRAKAIETIKAAYSISSYSEPEILWYDNPFIAIQETTRIENFRSYLGRSVHTKFSKRVFDHVQHGLTQQLEYKFFIRLRNQTTHTEFPYYSTFDKPQPYYFHFSVINCLQDQLLSDLEKTCPQLEFSDILYFTDCMFRPAEWANWACLFDFCISVLALHHDKKKWTVIQQLIQNCGFLLQYENVCIACDRPSKLSFDAKNLLHADGEPALQFADGYGVYADHGKSPFNAR